MSILSSILFVLLSNVICENRREIQTEHDSYSRGEWLSYNNGLEYWLCWEHQYRGVWFNLDDFIPGSSPGMELEQTEIWFYHSTSYPWDTSETYIEFWNGNSTGPVDFLERETVTASSYGPVFLDHSPDWIAVDVQFWIIQNTQLSSGGWPSLVADNSNQSCTHSMISPEMIVWIPFTPQGSFMQPEFFISTIIEYPWAHGWDLRPLSWASLKSVF